MWYHELLAIFWRQIDPTDAGGQFTDRWYHYTTGIFPLDESQRAIATQSKKDLWLSEKVDSDIVTEIEMFTEFYLAEEYHQNFYKKSSERYEEYAEWSWRKDYIRNNEEDS